MIAFRFPSCRAMAVVVTAGAALSFGTAGEIYGAAQEGAERTSRPQWPQFGYDGANTGQSPYKGPQTNRLKWDYRLPGWGSTVVVAADGSVYFGSGNSLFALSAGGSEKWRFRVPAGQPPAELPPAER
ncbi:MAG: PQQ-like beta-propeller repeat protein, partial [Planctomycetes bacterium]|nr:PQQ-like beta-propeller repeat protein [Planctomycetota bacterium]